MLNGTGKHLLQAERLCTELYMVVQPFPHFPFFVFDGDELSFRLFHNVYETA